jgi:DNA-binding beta-propeller fold protein YncE
LRRLEEKYAGELVVIGVHSAKFPMEYVTANLREAIMRHDIRHPVVNDVDFQVWQRYLVKAWPTIVLIDPLGRYVASQPGEVTFEQLDPIIGAMAAEFSDFLDHRPLAALTLEAASEPGRLLQYPAKLLATEGGRLYVSDTGHHRVLEIVLDADRREGEVVQVFGSGSPGFADGGALDASFNNPHGLAVHEQTLYVADTENHAIRAIDLAGATVRTIAGTGEKASGMFALGLPTETPLRSPWDLLAVEGALFIALAGSHQIWVLLDEEQLGPFAGSGREELVDGVRGRAGFNQPSGLAFDGANLYVADAEASAVRFIRLDTQGYVGTLVGEGLFEFGDVDGVAEEVRLQHPTGVIWSAGSLFLADTYNHKIKQLDPQTRRVTTLVGSGQPGRSDGSFATASLYEPQGLAIADQTLFIADTNNHLIRVADLTGTEVWTLTLRGLERERLC